MRTAIAIAACLASTLFAGNASAGTCTSEIEQVTKIMATKDAGSGPTSGVRGSTASQSQQSQAQHPPGAIMSQQTEGKATSPEDVRRQTEGRPTTTEQATGASGSQGNQAEASASLAKAREHDAAGREAECMEAVKNAKSLTGS